MRRAAWAWAGALLVGVVVGGGGCSATPGPTGFATASASAPTASASAASPRPAGSGLDATTNDPEIVALAKGVLSCHWKVGHGYSNDCPPGVAWYETKLFGDDKSLPTLVAFLEDADPAIRALAAEALRVHGYRYSEDPALSARVLGAAERETDGSLLADMGDLAGPIDLEKTKLVERGLALAASTAPLVLRAAQIRSLRGANPYSPKVFQFLKGALRDDDREVRVAAIDALQSGGDVEVCALLAGELDAELHIATRAARALVYGGNGNCAEQFDAVLGWLEKVPVDPPNLAEVVATTEQLCADREATTAQEKRGAKLLRGLATNEKLEPGMRAAPVRALPACDTDSQAFAGKLKTSDEELQRIASEVAATASRATGPAPDVLGPNDPEPEPIDPSKPIRDLDAVAFLTEWDAGTGLDLMAKFPPGPYRVTGVVIGVERRSHGGARLSVLGPPGEAVHLELTGKGAAAALKKRRGDKVTALCDFGGEGGEGYATFKACRWELP